MINRDTIEMWGENKRMQPLQCIVALWGLKKLKEVIKIRNKNIKLIIETLFIFYVYPSMSILNV